MHNRRLVITLRLLGFLAVLVAEVSLVVQLGADFAPANHFSYFTVLSNVFGAVVLLVGVFHDLPDLVRGAAVVYLATTGVVYWTLLRGADVGTPTYVNYLLHAVMPVLVVVEWLLAPPAATIQLRRALWWLAFPVGYLAYSLARGPLVDWYPYPFLDPRPDGYIPVALTCTGVAVAIAAIALLTAYVGTTRHNQVAAGKRRA